MFYPRKCVLCDRLLTAGERFCCRVCEDSLPYIGEEYCLKCGKPVGEGEEYCMDCSRKETTFISGRGVFRYNSLMRESIARYKYHGRKEYARFYGREIYKQWGEWILRLAPDALIPVPIHRKRYHKRGFNQAELVAKELGAMSGVPVISDYLVRQRNTLPQKGLSDRERAANLSHAFCVRNMEQELYKSLNCVIIIDDIYTTGSTIEACSQTLCKQGIKKVYFLCICIGQGY